MIDWFLDDNLKYFTNFPEIQNDALFLVIYSFFEISLSRVCSMVARDAKVRGIILAPATNNYIEGSKKFLVHAANIKIKAKEKYLEEIKQIKRL